MLEECHDIVQALHERLAFLERGFLSVPGEVGGREIVVQGPAIVISCTRLRPEGKGSGAKPRVVKDNDPDAQRIQRVYNVYKKLTGGADGGVMGVNGSLTSGKLTMVLKMAGVKGKHFIDMGAGDGRVILAAKLLGAIISEGYELPGNRAHQGVFEAVEMECEETGICPPGAPTVFNLRDIDTLETLEGVTAPTCVFSFWVGFHPETQKKILRLCAENENVVSIAVFRDRKWTIFQNVLDVLNKFAPAKSTWTHDVSETVKTTMMGSRQEHTCWVFYKVVLQPLVPAGDGGVPRASIVNVDPMD